MKAFLRKSVVLFVLAWAVACWAAPELSMVSMRDGVRLATDCYLPEGDGPFPVVLARSVYGRKGNDWARPWVEAGVAFVIQDTRGRGDSEGEDRVFLDDGWGEKQDGADTLAWLRAQPWCNGKVGMFGGSALSIVQVLAAVADPDITCQAIWVASSKFYGQLAYQGGVFRKALCENWLRHQKNLYILELWHAHPTEDEFWAQFDAETVAHRVHAPAVHVGGWWDIFAQGTLENFTTRQTQGAPGARGTQRLIMGPWVHGPLREVGDVVLPENYREVDFEAYTREFMRHWLLDEPNGAMDAPPIRYYTMGDFGDPDAPGNEWRSADAWPPFETRETPYFLGPEGLIDTAPQPETTYAYTFDPADPCPTHGGANLSIPPGPYDQRKVSGRADVVTFATPPLETPVEITGRVRARLFVSSDAPDTDFTAKLVDIYPDGREILMLDGIRRVKFRRGYDRAEPLPPGEIGELEIDLWSISLIVNAGHRIGLQVSSSNFPRFEVNPNTGADLPAEGGELRPARNTIHAGGAYPSALILPVRPPAAEDGR